MVKKAVIIGINYIGTSVQLSGCVNDSINFKNLLINHYGYTNQNIVHLFDGSGSTNVNTPNYANIIKAISWLITGAKAGDSLVFTYSGHGATVIDRNGDEESGLDGVLCPTDFRNGNLIVDDFLKTYLADKIPKDAKLTIVIDACHSGTMFDLRYNIVPKIVKPSKKVGTILGTDTVLECSYEIQTKQKTTLGDVCCISGCRDNQTSADTFAEGQACGALSWSIFKILKKYNYVIDCIHFLKEMQNFLNDAGYTQIPQMSFGRIGDTSRSFTFSLKQ